MCTVKSIVGAKDDYFVAGEHNPMELLIMQHDPKHVVYPPHYLLLDDEAQDQYHQLWDLDQRSKDAKAVNVDNKLNF